MIRHGGAYKQYLVKGKNRSVYDTTWEDEFTSSSTANFQIYPFEDKALIGNDRAELSSNVSEAKETMVQADPRLG